MRPRRVVFVAPFGVYRRGTTRARVIPLAAALAAQGHHVQVIVPDWDSPTPVSRRYRVGAAEVAHLTSPDAGTRLVSAHLLRRVYLAVLASQPDIIHCFKPIGYSGLVALLASSLARRAGWRGLLAVDTDDLEGREGWANYTGRPEWQIRLLDWQERSTPPRANLTTAASADLVRRMHQLGCSEQAVVYLPNGVTLSKGHDSAQTPAEQAAAPTLLLYTRFNEFSPRRGAAITASILQRVRGARLMVVGDGPGPAADDFFRELDRRGLGARVARCGFLTGDALRRALDIESVALWLFDDNEINRARSPAKLLELLARGRAVVAERVGEVLALAAGTARLVPPGDSDSVVEEAAELLEEGELRRRQGHHARKVISRTSGWASRAATLESAYGVHTHKHTQY